MSIKYSLFPNHLTDDPNDHLAIVQDQTPRSMEDIIDIMIGRGSTVTKAEALSVIEEYEAAIAQLLGDGDSINTPLFRISASIPGVFVDQNDSFEPSRHYVRLNVNPGSRIGEIAGELPVEKVAASTPRPVLQVFRDIETDTINESLTPGGAGELNGTHMKVDEEDPQQGVFLIAADGTETKAETLVRNKPANLIFMIPEGLASGEYEVEVRNILFNGTELRTGRLDASLVAP